MTKQEAEKELELIFRMADRIEELSEGLSDETFSRILSPFYNTAADLAVENGITENEMEAIEVRINAGQQPCASGASAS